MLYEVITVVHTRELFVLALETGVGDRDHAVAALALVVLDAGHVRVPADVERNNFV